MRHVSPEEYQRLFAATGELIIHWGLVEESLNMIIALVYQLGGGKHIEPELQIMMSRRIRFLRACFNRIAALDPFKVKALSLLDRVGPIADLRETLCHSAITGVSDDGETYHFTSSRPMKSRTIHYLKKADIAHEKLTAAAYATLALGDEAAGFMQRLYQALVGKQPDAEVSGGL